MGDLIANLIRDNYDRLAENYTEHVFGELQHKPFDRQLLERFAASTAWGRVCDMGCGPGHVARYLHIAGADVFGLDLSPRMLEEARRLNPEITFREGDMLALDLADESLAGITAFYAIVNLSRLALPTVLGQMHRVLRRGGLLLLAFHAGDEKIEVSQLWGQLITMDFYFHDPQWIARLLETERFKVEESLMREPYAPEVEYQSRRAYIFARKPR